MKVWNKYANTAARKHGKPGREQRPKSITIDAHAHIAVPRAVEFVKPYLDVSTVPLEHFTSFESKQVFSSPSRNCLKHGDWWKILFPTPPSARRK